MLIRTVDVEFAKKNLIALTAASVRSVGMGMIVGLLVKGTPVIAEPIKKYQRKLPTSVRYQLSIDF